jgi:ATP phosphoribosyltransferase regulatory subunit
MESLDNTDEIKEDIRELIEQKNYPALVDLLEQFKDQRAAAAHKNLRASLEAAKCWKKAKPVP